MPIYDNNGNLTNLNGWTYSCDAQNRLLSASNGAGTTETFAYDPQNRCVSRTLNGVTTYFVYDGWQLAEDLNGSGVEQALYVSGANVDELLYKATSAATVFYQHDALGNTTALSDTNGNLVEHYTYDVFGKPSFFDANNNPLTASAYGNRFLFTGHEYLQEVGLCDYRNRVYSANLGRFLQTDPLLFAPGDENMYRYVGNNVVNKIDLFGTDPAFDRQPQDKDGPPIIKAGYLSIDNDGRGPSHGDRSHQYQTTGQTTAKTSPNADVTPYIVAPKNYERQKVECGQQFIPRYSSATLTISNGFSTSSVLGPVLDFGNDDKFGEISVAAARRLLGVILTKTEKSGLAPSSSQYPRDPNDPADRIPVTVQYESAIKGKDSK